MTQYMLVPVSEHPLFPGSSQSLSLSKEQYEILKTSDHTVFASIVSNDEIFKKSFDMMAMLDHSHHHKPDLSFNLPEIKDLSDVYQTGVICDTKVIKDEKNLFMPYVLNLFPIEKARLLSKV
jgi:hypothetical protein